MLDTIFNQCSKTESVVKLGSTCICEGLKTQSALKFEFDSMVRIGHLRYKRLELINQKYWSDGFIPRRFDRINVEAPDVGY